jgi:hypothetical protein
MRRRPFPFAYYVFFSKAEVPTDQERESGVYLVETADARYLQKFFDPLYESAEIGICTSDDEVISGKNSLAALAEAVRRPLDPCTTRGMADNRRLRFRPLRRSGGDRADSLANAVSVS